MPKGVPKNGFRRTKNYLIRESLGLPHPSKMTDTEKMAQATLSLLPTANLKQALGVSDIKPAELPVDIKTNESEHEISCRISERFVMMSELIDAAINGDIRAMVISGPPGVGKSFTLEGKLSKLDEGSFSVVRGKIKATGLFRKLYEHRHEGNILVLDDADDVFFDATSLNILKAACDTTEKRTISYLSEATFVDDDGEKLPRSFEFEGTIVFITNYDLDREIARSSKVAPHLQAMASRAMHFDVGLKSRRECLVRIKQVIDCATRNELRREDVDEIMHYLETNIENVRELSIRTALKIATLRKMGPHWKTMANVVICKGK